MINLRALLRYNYPYIIVLVLAITYSFIYISLNINLTHYQGNETKISGIIDTIKYNGNHLMITLKAKELVVINYYIKEYSEYLKIKNNYQLGDYLILSGVFKEPNKNSNFNLFNYHDYLLSKKINWTFLVTKIIDHQPNQNISYNFKNNINKYLDRYLKSSSYLKAYLLGDTSNIEENINDSYQTNGISYLFAVSGLHITLLSMILVYFFKKIFKRTIMIYGIVIIILLLYMFMTNFPISAVRASMLFSLIFINRTLNLQIKTINILMVIFSMLIINNPYIINSIGFQFTFIISFYMNIYQKIIKRYNNYFIKILVISIFFFIVGMPILMNNYFSINLLTPLINLIFIPVVTLILLPLGLLTIIIPMVNPIFVAFINIIESLSVLMSNNNLEIVLAKPPLYIIILYYIVITIILNKIKVRNYKYIFILIMMLFIHINISLINKDPIITMLDVGQGDCILITLPNNEGNLLFDTGGLVSYGKEAWQIGSEFSLADSIIIPYLKSIGISHLDYLILTHGDADHIKEAYNLVKKYKVDNVFLNSGKNNTLEVDLINTLKAKAIPFKQISKYNLKINDYSFSFINTRDYKSENSDSLIVYSDINNFDILLMGDADKTNEEQIIKTYSLPQIDILKVGHHGSKYSTSLAFINQIKPKISLISVASKNLYNHPDQATINTLNNSDIYLTSKRGIIKIILSDKLIIKTAK